MILQHRLLHMCLTRVGIRCGSLRIGEQHLQALQLIAHQTTNAVIEGFYVQQLIKKLLQRLSGASCTCTPGTQLY